MNPVYPQSSECALIVITAYLVRNLAQSVAHVAKSKTRVCTYGKVSVLLRKYDNAPLHILYCHRGNIYCSGGNIESISQLKR